VLGALVAAAMVVAAAAVRRIPLRAVQDARPWVRRAMAGFLVGAGTHLALELAGANQAWCAVAFPA